MNDRRALLDLQRWVLKNMRRMYIWVVINGFTWSIIGILSNKYNLIWWYTALIVLFSSVVIFTLIPSDS